MSHDQSHLAFARAKQLIPGGVNSPARAFGGVGGEPIFIDRAEGAHLVDIDGTRYLDYIGSWGPMILGHAHPAVSAALEGLFAAGPALALRRWPKTNWPSWSSRPSCRSKRFVWSTRARRPRSAPSGLPAAIPAGR